MIRRSKLLACVAAARYVGTALSGIASRFESCIEAETAVFYVECSRGTRGEVEAARDHLVDVIMSAPEAVARSFDIVDVPGLGITCTVRMIVADTPIVVKIHGEGGGCGA